MKSDFTILISSVGRRAQLVGCFRRAAKELGFVLTVLGTDAAPELSSASHLVDRCFKVPPCSDPRFVPEIASISGEHKVDLIIPTIDHELPVYANHLNEFERAGSDVLISSPSTIEISSDKCRTNEWLIAHGFPTVAQQPVEHVLRDYSKWTFPVIVKPRRGSASIGVRIVNEVESLRSLKNQGTLLVESMARGVEYTTNLFVDRWGRCLCAVPHQRLETRGGEVSKGITVKNLKLMELAKGVAEALPGARGPLNLQGFVDSNNDVQFTEINARFGGGFPLAAEAGADFCRWILEEMAGLPSSASFSSWHDRLLMLRFDSAIFVKEANQSGGQP
jgi:carbamoyl-phosphate synthase large subunit